MTQPKAVRQRASKPKVRTGCDRCKTRRVKCDEAKPQCTGCVRFGAACNYSFRPGGQPPKSATPQAILPAPVFQDRLYPSPSSLLAKLTAQESRYLEYFMRKLSDQFSFSRLGDSSMTSFWFGTILQQIEHAEYIRDTILGIGALAWARKSTPGRVPLIHHRLSGALRNQHYQSALRYYSSAIGKLKSLLFSAPPEVQLQETYTSCLLFLMFELLQENGSAVDKLGAIGMEFYSRLRLAASPDYVQSASTVTHFMTTNCVVYMSVSPRSPSIRTAVQLHVSPALQPPAVVGKYSNIQEFVSAWWRLLTTVINLGIHPAAEGFDHTESDGAPQLCSLLALIGSWEKEARKRLAAAQETDSTNLLRLIVAITSRLAPLAQARQRPSWTHEIGDADPFSICLLDCGAILDLFRLYQTQLANEAGSPSAEDEFDINNEAIHSPALPALLHIARRCPCNATRSEALDLFRSILHIRSASNLKAIYMVLRSLADIERREPVNRYDWTKGSWNHEYTALHVTLTPVVCAGNQNPRSKHLILRAEDYRF